MVSKTIDVMQDGRCIKPKVTPRELCFYFPERRDLSTNKSAREREWSTKAKVVLSDIRERLDASDNAVVEDASALAHDERARTSLVQ